ncbi:MAG: AMP-binding protein [Candidatus Omnitrophica bacterium]|nr:AMP-binding protein [Candidatus Omnitrophota bacterium]
MHIQDLLKKHAQNCSDKSAIIFEGRSISFSEVKAMALGVSNYLQIKGIGKDDKVALFLPNIPETIYSFLGVFCLGACVVPLDYMLTEEEVINFLNHSQAKLLIIQPRKGVDLDKIKSSCPDLGEIVTELSFEKTDEISLDISESDLAAIFYTSGSTGHPKGVMLNYSQLGNPPKVIDQFLSVSSGDVFLCGGVPFSHVGGLDYILLMLYFSCKLVLMPRFHPFEFLKNIQEHKVTIFCIVPAMFMAILSLKEYQGFDFSSLRYAVVFGAPSSPALLKRFHRAYPNAQLANGWGMTETAAPNTISPPGDDKIRSIGNFTSDLEVKIVDPEGKSLGLDKKGELMVKGKAVTKGYFREPDLTKEALTEDGWFRTGDIASFDSQGLYYIVGRKKDMIKVAGEIVFPAEVEEKISQCPKVKEAAVIGVGDKLRGEVPKAFIVAKDGENLDDSELKDFLKQSLAHFKMPHYFEFVKELPKNRTGKIDKTKLINRGV